MWAPQHGDGGTDAYCNPLDRPHETLSVRPSGATYQANNKASVIVTRKKSFYRFGTDIGWTVPWAQDSLRSNWSWETQHNSSPVVQKLRWQLPLLGHWNKRQWSMPRFRYKKLLFDNTLTCFSFRKLDWGLHRLPICIASWRSYQWALCKPRRSFQGWASIPWRNDETYIYSHSSRL